MQTSSLNRFDTLSQQELEVTEGGFSPLLLVR